ncbi:zinc finger protein ZFAT-like [Galleria mellonella]|uniref:Zinc finger protein ZFAT-like n=1 Tax=Galleria mellonella TaxID=7137 RepID=A0A6J1X6Y0_GALME|nr:zinc finger protein ZFAT-like [Galleria mellonella]
MSKKYTQQCGLEKSSQVFAKDENNSMSQNQVINNKSPRLLTESNETPHNSESSLDIVESLPSITNCDIKVEEFDDNVVNIDDCNVKDNNTANNEADSDDDEDIELIEQEIIIENEMLKSTFKNNDSLQKLLEESANNLLNTNCGDSINDSYTSLYKVFSFSSDNIVNKSTHNDNHHIDTSLGMTNANIDSSKQNSQNSNKIPDVSQHKNTSIAADETVPAKEIDLSVKGLKQLCLELDENEMFRKAEIIRNTASNVADRILAVELLNNWGRVKHAPCKPTIQETLLQDALDEWKNWNKLSRHREIPLTYKCYVCKIAYWRLTPFREHIAQHVDIKIGCEFVLYESHIKAYTVEEDTIKSFPIEGNCFQCHKGYEAHPSLGGEFKHYKCSFCKENFFTCIALMIHEEPCKHLKKKRLMHVSDINLHKCKVCPMSFYNKEQLNKHLKLSHMVWSDVPILSGTKLCTLCNQRYSVFLMHICNKKMAPKFICSFCNRRFPSQKMLDLHIDMLQSNHQCRICNLTLKKSCMEVIHLLIHSKRFMKVYRCALCKDNKIYPKLIDMKKHKKMLHKEKFISHNILYDIMLIIKNVEEKQKYVKEVKTVVEQISASDEQRFAIENLMKEMEDPSDQNEVIQTPNVEIQTVNESIFETAEIDNRNVNIVIDEEQTQEYDNNEVIIDSDTENDDDFNENAIVNNNFDNHQTDNVEVDAEVRDEKEIEVADGCSYEESNHYVSNMLQKPGFFVEIKVENNNEHQGVNSNDIIGLNNDLTEDTVVNEPRRNLYKCGKCKLDMEHKEYQKHRSSCPSRDGVKFKRLEKTYHCSKCTGNYISLKKYIIHLSKVHNLERLVCVLCGLKFGTDPNLRMHFDLHIRRLYLRVRCCSKEDNVNNTIVQCKKCRSNVAGDKLFSHWESHFVMPDQSVVKPSEPAALPAPLYEGALNPTDLKNLITYLQMDMTNRHMYKMIKRCPCCRRYFSRAIVSKRHFVEHLLRDAYASIERNGGLKCQICSEIFEGDDNYKVHMRDHGFLPVYMCEICNKSFSDSSNFSKHRKLHDQSVHVCQLCKKKFQHKESLLKHNVEVHEKSKPKACSYCSTTFYTESSLKKHVRNNHERPLPAFRCKICKKVFPTTKSKLEHMWAAHRLRCVRTQNANCPICHEPFRKYQDVKYHLENVHSMEKSTAAFLVKKQARKYQAAKKKRELLIQN